MATVIFLIIKFLAKAIMIFWSTSLFAQNPTTGTFISQHIYCGFWTRPGVAGIDCPRFFQMNDSTEFHIYPLRMYFDSAMNFPSQGSPQNFMWLNPANKQFIWSSIDSLRLPYSQITGTPALPSGTVTSAGLSSTDFTVSGSPITTSGNITANLTTTGVTSGTYFGVFTVDTKGRITSSSNPVLDTLSPSRSFNIPYQMSTTSWVTVSPSFSVSCSLSLSGGQSAEVYLEWSINGSTGWTRAALVPASNTGSLTIGLNTVQMSGGTAVLTLPPSYWWRLRTNNVTGTPTYTFTGGSKITY